LKPDFWQWRRRRVGIRMFEFNIDEDQYVKVKMVGVGDFGAEMVNYSIANSILNVKFAVVGTKNETLLKSSAPQRIKVSDSIDEETKKNFSALVKDLDLLFIFTDLADENISMQIAESTERALKVAILPSANLDKEKLEKFQGVADSLIILEKNNIELILSAVRCINSLVSEPGVVGLDFADVKSVLEKSGRCYVGYGRAKGEQPIIEAMNSAINSLDNLHNSKRFLIGFFGWYENLSMLEVNEATTILQEAAHPDAEIILGVVTDITNQDFVEVIVISAENFLRRNFYEQDFNFG